MNQVLRERPLLAGTTFQLVQGDLTQESVDAIVNAANARLQHGGGVAGLIVRRGGAVIQQESNAWLQRHGPVSHSEPAYTSAGSLPCRYVIHAVGPIWGEGDENAKLAAAFKGSLRLADQLDLRSIAFPAISTGIFGFPKLRAAQVVLSAVGEYFAEHPGSKLKFVRLTLFDQPTVEVFVGVWDGIE